MKKRKHRSAGARQLGRLGLTDSDIAARLGCTQQQVNYWKTGARVPRSPARERMRAEFGIPPESWDADVVETSGASARGRPAAPVVEVTGAPLDYTPAAVPARAPVGPTPVVHVALTVADQAQRLHGLVNRLVDAIETDGSLSPLEALRYAREGHQLLDRLGRLTGESLLVAETRIVRLPAFRNIADRIVGALRKWPDAQVAVADELEAMGGR